MVTPGAHGVDGGELRLQHGAVHAFHLGAGRAHEQHAGHVAGVAVLKGAHIDHHQIAGGKAGRGGLRVRQGGADAGGDDGLEARLFGAQAAHAVFQFGGEIAFADAGLDAGDGLLEGAGVGLHAAADERELRGGLHHAQLFDPAGDGLQRSAQRQARLDRLEGVAGHAGGLVADALDAALCASAASTSTHQRAFGDADLAGGFLRGLDLVARVGEQDASPGRISRAPLLPVKPER